MTYSDAARLMLNTSVLASNCYLYGQGLLHKARIDEWGMFYVRIRHSIIYDSLASIPNSFPHYAALPDGRVVSFRENLTYASGIKFFIYSVALFKGSNQLAPEFNFQDDGKGLYTFSYRAKKAFELDLMVEIDGVLLPGMPLRIPVEAQAAVGSKSSVSGSGLKFSKPGFYATFVLTAKDWFYNPLAVGGQGQNISVYLRSLDSSSSSSSFPCSQLQNYTLANLQVADLTSGRYNVRYRMPETSAFSTAKRVLICVLFLNEIVRTEDGTSLPGTVDISSKLVCGVGEQSVESDGYARCVQCLEGTYNLQVNGACRKCPIGAACPGGSVLLAITGYYQSSIKPDVFYYCLVEEACCPTGFCMNDAWKTDDNAGLLLPDGSTVLSPHCAINRRGSMCAECVQGTAEWSGKCVPCPAPYDGGTLVLYAFLIAAIIVSFIYWRHLSNIGDIKIYRVFIDYFQNVFLIIIIPKGLPSVSSFFFLKLDMFESSRSAKCIAHIDVLDKLMIPLVILVYFIFVLLAFYLISRLIYYLRSLVYNLNEAITHVSWTIFFVFYGSISDVTFTLFNCSTIDGEFVMSKYPASGECFKGKHLSYAILTSFFFASLIIGTPLLLSWLYKNFNMSTHTSFDSLSTKRGREDFRRIGKSQQLMRRRYCLKYECCCLEKYCAWWNKDDEAVEEAKQRADAYLTSGATGIVQTHAEADPSSSSPSAFSSHLINRKRHTPQVVDSGGDGGVNAVEKPTSHFIAPPLERNPAVVFTFAPRDVQILSAHGQMYIGYNRNVRSFFEYFMVLRRTVFVGISVFISGENAAIWMRPAMGLAAFVFLLINLSLRPYSVLHYNTIQTVCLMYMMAVSMIGQAVYNGYLLTDYTAYGWFGFWVFSLFTTFAPMLQIFAHEMFERDPDGDDDSKGTEDASIETWTLQVHGSS